MGPTDPIPEIDALWDYANPAASEARFREALPLAAARGNESLRLELVTQLARAQGLQEQFDKAHLTLDEVQQRVDDDPDVSPLVHVRCLLERGRVFNSSGQRERAVPLFVEAWERADAAGLDRLAIDAVHMVAIAEPEPAAQVEWNLKGIELATSRDQRGWLSALYNNLGEAHLRRGDPARALESFDAYADLYRAAGRDVPWYAHKDRAKCLRLLGRADEALALIRPVHEQLATRGEANGYSHMELAECLLATGAADEARPHFAAAYEQLSRDPWFVRHEPATLERVQAQARPT